MQMIPMKDLKDGARVSRLCHETGEPVHVTKNGRADLVVMSAEVYEGLAGDARTGRAVALVREGIEAVRRGEATDALEAVAAMRGKYGL